MSKANDGSGELGEPVRDESEVVNGIQPNGASDDCDQPSGGEMPAVADAEDGAENVTTDKRGDEHRVLDASVAERLGAIEARVDTGIDRVLEVFRHKLAYDRSKDLQVDRLHEELQQHRADFVGKAIRGLVLGVISLHDQYVKLVASLRRKSAHELDLDRVFRLLEGVPEDVVLLLANHGVEPFREEPGERFDPKRQRVLRTVPTGDRETGGTVAESVLPGFEQGGQIVERERVSVYKYKAALAEAAVVEPLETADAATSASSSGEEIGGVAAAAGSQERED